MSLEGYSEVGGIGDLLSGGVGHSSIDAAAAAASAAAAGVLR